MPPSEFSVAGAELGAQNGQNNETSMRIDPQRAKVLASNLAHIRSRVIAAKSTEASRAVRLVAISKLKPHSDILELHSSTDPASSHPQIHFGENYLQELQHKASVLPRSICWHFVGGLQSNKCKTMAQDIPNLWCVSSVDTEKKAKELEKGRRAFVEALEQNQEHELGTVDEIPSETRFGKKLRVLVQVNTSGEESKSGVEPGSQTVELCKLIKEDCPHLQLAGLMTIGAIARSHQSEETDNEDFETLKQAKDDVEKQLNLPQTLELSMGMSADFEAAIRQGSTEVRVGSDIFGERMNKEEAKEWRDGLKNRDGGN